MKKILIINGHPDKGSYCFALAESYRKGAVQTGADCKVLNLIDLQFNPILTNGYRMVSDLEPDLLQAQKDISECNLLVLVYPNWWGTYPALLKGFIDRVFVPNFAFKYREKGPFWDKLLTGKTAQLIVTMDTPAWYYWLINKSPGHNSMKIGILGFSGFKPVRIKSFGPIKSSTVQQRAEWLKEVRILGSEQE